MCSVVSTTDSGVNVELLEYCNLPAFISAGDISKHSWKQILKKGNDEVLRVINVDKKGSILNIDLTRRNLLQVDEFKERYKKGKQVHGIMRTLAQKLHVDIQELYNEFCWKLYQDYDHAFDAFKIAFNNSLALTVNPNDENFDVFSTTNISHEHKKVLLDILSKKLIAKPVIIKATFELNCFSCEGINAIKYSLDQASQLSTNALKLSLLYVSSPIYEIKCETTKQKEGLDLINKALTVVEDSIIKKQGKFKLLQNPKIYGEEEKNDLEDQIKKLKCKVKEDVDGDTDNEEMIEQCEGTKFNLEEKDKLFMTDEADIEGNEMKFD